MPVATSTKARYAPTLLERLADDSPRELADGNLCRLITIEQLKESVATDLEALLNCRSAYQQNLFAKYPEARKSLCTYGMQDFIGLSLANPGDRNHICRSLEMTIDIHEPRLSQVSVSLEIDTKSVNKLRFSIHALLMLQPNNEPVHFDAMLQPSTLQYSVSRGRQRAVN